MATLNFPTLSRVAPETFTFEQQSNTHTFGASPFSGEIQTIEMPGARWQGSFDWSGLNEDDAGLWQAFMVKLRGQAGRFNMHRLDRPAPRGVAIANLANPANNPKVVAIGDSTQFRCDNFHPNVQKILRAGDMIGMGGELKMVIDDFSSDGNGECFFIVEPPMRVLPSINVTEVILTKPTAIFMVTEDKVGWTANAPLLTDSAFQFVETFS